MADGQEHALDLLVAAFAQDQLDHRVLFFDLQDAGLGGCSLVAFDVNAAAQLVQALLGGDAFDLSHVGLREAMARVH
jgi:hypothetical protein